MTALQRLIDGVRDELVPLSGQGKVADYIPELARIDPTKFAISVANPNGEVVSTGDADEPFSIQSISKVFTLALALGKVGDALWNRVGREPSGTAFNSIVQLEHENAVFRETLLLTPGRSLSQMWFWPVIAPVKRSVKSYGLHASSPTTKP